MAAKRNPPNYASKQFKPGDGYIRMSPRKGDEVVCALNVTHHKPSMKCTKTLFLLDGKWLLCTRCLARLELIVTQEFNRLALGTR